MTKSTRPARAAKTPAPVAAPVAPAPAPKPAKRSMKGINASGNTPWRKKLYAPGENKDWAKQPGQVQGILRYMNSEGFKPARGGEICYQAIDQGFVKTKIAPDVLFAYYRKAMEDGGFITFVGYVA